MRNLVLGAEGAGSHKLPNMSHHGEVLMDEGQGRATPVTCQLQGMTPLENLIEEIS